MNLESRLIVQIPAQNHNMSHNSDIQTMLEISIILFLFFINMYFYFLLQCNGIKHGTKFPPGSSMLEIIHWCM